jgi:dienelactone hydrolase
MRVSIAAVAAVLALASPGFAADEHLVPRTELHPFQSLTLSDAAFLKGDAAAGTPVELAGELRLPRGAGKFPAVILQHGSGGVGGNVDMWTHELNAIGIATFTMDGFTGRGLTQVSTDQAKLGRLNFVLDIYRALDVLAKSPRIDTSRVALMGFSRGGQAALYASLKRFHRMWNTSRIEFTAYVPFYPDCMTTYISDTDVADKPIRIFQGTPDDYNPVAPCKAFVARLKAAGHDVVLKEYPNASHAFDNPLGAVPAAASPKSQTVRHCVIREEPEGTLINVSTGQPFAYTDACVEHGPHVGYDATATEDAKTGVKTFLQATFKRE